MMTEGWLSAAASGASGVGWGCLAVEQAVGRPIMTTWPWRGFLFWRRHVSCGPLPGRRPIRGTTGIAVR